MIVTGKAQTAQGKAQFIKRAGRAPYLGYAYEGLKYASRTYGFYKDIKPYLPETYLDKFKYKPRKRVAGYVGQKLYESKKKNNGSNNKFYKKRSRFDCVNWSFTPKSFANQSCQHTAFN